MATGYHTYSVNLAVEAGDFIAYWSPTSNLSDLRYTAGSGTVAIVDSVGSNPPGVGSAHAFSAYTGSLHLQGTGLG